MALPKGGLALLDRPVAERLLASTTPARLAYTAADNTPVSGDELVMSSMAGAAESIALQEHPDVEVVRPSSASETQACSCRSARPPPGSSGRGTSSRTRGCYVVVCHGPTRVSKLWTVLQMGRSSWWTAVAAELNR